jgi:hypothetical protein
VAIKVACQELPTVPVPFGATLALGAIFLVSGASLLRGDKRRRSSRA